MHCYLKPIYFFCCPLLLAGEPYYPKLGIVGSPTKPANPTKRRRGSILSGCRVKTAELPLGQDVINSLPALCFPGKHLLRWANVEHNP